MRIYVLSDLHAERSAFTPDPSALQAADVVVLAGDINYGESTPFWAREKFGDKPIVLVIGNHEFYDRHRIARGAPSIWVSRNAAWRQSRPNWLEG